ncbi:ATP-dependent helicase [Aestuariimicrobium soli]|uniref:ATP-dependent helicase n=1 Tax=Aestuariimicrobium soli TaxID=2035834 RepID=UPI003EC05880
MSELTTMQIVLPSAPVRPVPDRAQSQALSWCGQVDSLLVLGGPGTGKTSLVVESVCARVEAGAALESCLVLAPTRPAAQALRAQIARTIGGSHVRPRVMTLHALAHAIRNLAAPAETLALDRPAPARLLTAPESEFRIRELLAHHDVSAWPEHLRPAVTTQAFASEVRQAISRVRQLGLDPAAVAQLGGEAARPEWVALAEFFEEYLDVLDAEGVLDYAEVVHRARLALLDPATVAAVRQPISGVWVDDLGEHDPAQIGLLADVLGAGLPLVATGDPGTSVFAFRGADPRVLADFDSLLARDGRSSRVVTLEVNHRNRPGVARAVARVEARLPRPVAHRPASPESGVEGESAGVVRVRIFDSVGAEAEHIAHTLREARLDDQIAWERMAVITRTGRSLLPLLARTLTVQGVPVRLGADDMPLHESAAVKALQHGLEAALLLAQRDGDDPGGPDLPPDTVDALLRSPLGSLDGLALRRLGRQLRSQADDVHLDVLSSQAWRAALVSHPDLLPHVGASPEAESARTLGRLLQRAADVIRRNQSASAALWCLWDGTGWPARLEALALADGEGAAAAHRDLDAVVALFDVANRDTVLVGARAVRALVAEIDAHDIAADHARETGARARGVLLTTAHRVKGEEFDVVVVAGVQEGAWPSTRRIGTVLEASQLTEDGVAGPEPFSVRINQERRLFLLAASRARQRLEVTCSTGVEGEADQPSRFLTELFDPGEAGPERVVGRPRRPLTMTALVSDLRRVLEDPAANPHLREHAAARLAQVSRVRGADPRWWWGVHEYSQATTPATDPRRAVRLSPSEVESLLGCSRRWFLDRKARAQSTRGSAASLGSVIHVLAQHASQADLPVDELSRRLDEVWDQIPFDAAWLSHSERVVAEEALGRFAVWHAASQRRVLGVEVPFRVVADVPVTDGTDRVELVGVVDRLEVDTEGRLHVVDLKTGRMTPTQKQVDEHAQLGVYQLAAELGAFDHLAPDHAGVGGAELVYLRKDDKSGGPSVLRQAPLVTDADDETWVSRQLGGAVETVRGEDYRATPNDMCRFCAHVGSCPVWATERGTGQPGRR